MDLVETVQRRLAEAGWEVLASLNESVEEAQESIRGHEGDVVLAMGGDGTIHTTIQALDLGRHTLGFIPVGSGNDIYRNTGQGTDLDSALAPLLADRVVHWDLGQVAGRRFLNSAGVGLDAQTLQTRERTATPWLRKNYSALFLLTLARISPLEVRMTVDGQEIHQYGWWYIVANGPYIGGGMHITPGGSVTDGVFDVLCIEKLSKVTLVQCLPKVFKGTHLGVRGISVVRGRTIRFETPLGPQRIAVDGELTPDTTPVTFELLAGALRVFSMG